jgi:hypothetical protein
VGQGGKESRHITRSDRFLPPCFPAKNKLDRVPLPPGRTGQAVTASQPCYSRCCLSLLEWIRTMANPNGSTEGRARACRKPFMEDCPAPREGFRLASIFYNASTHHL